MRSGLTLGPLILAIAACQAPRQGFEAARTRLEQGDLVGALVQLDRVAPTDPDYAESRSLAMAIERRIRTSQRLFSRGLALRAQWRDEEAISYFELARQVWPRDDGASALIEATRYRMAAIMGGPAEPGSEEAGAVAMTQPIGVGATALPDVIGPQPEFDSIGEPGAPATVADDQDPPVVFVEGPPGLDDPVSPPPADVDSPAAPGVEVGSPADGDGSHVPPRDGAGSEVLLRARLGQARAALRGGRLQDALRILEQVHRSHPDSREVTDLWARVLHQRALLHYGQGELALAVDAWSKLLAAQPNHAQAREFHDAARSELDAFKRR